MADNGPADSKRGLAKAGIHWPLQFHTFVLNSLSHHRIAPRPNANHLLKACRATEEILPKSTPGDPEKIKKQLASLLEGAHVDWDGTMLDAKAFGQWLRRASTLTPPAPPIVIHNAKFDGDLMLDAIGTGATPLGLQLLNCQIDGGFRARQSHWSQLLLAKCKLKWVDVPAVRVERHLLIETVEAEEWLDLRFAEIGAKLVISDSSFASGEERFEAVNLSEAVVGQSLHAERMTLAGTFRAPSLRVTGDVSFDGSSIKDPDEPPEAMSLERADISGSLQMAPSRGKRFETKGRAFTSSLRARSFIMKGARLDGAGGPALVAENMSIAETLDLSGLAENGPAFESIGSLKLSGSRVGRQMQLFDFDIQSSDGALELYGIEVDGDLNIGTMDRPAALTGCLNAHRAQIRGRLILTNVSVKANDDTAIIVSGANVTGDVSIWSLNANGALRLGDMSASSLHIEVANIERVVPAPSLEGFPADYAHPMDTLIELNHVTIRNSVILESVRLDGGDLRIIGARVSGDVQLNNISIHSERGAIVAQGASISGSVMISGVPGETPNITGDMQLYGTSVGGDLTLLNLAIGSAENHSKIILRGSKLMSHFSVSRCTMHGEFNASGAEVHGDCRFQSSSQINPGFVACNVSGARIGGTLAWVTATQAEGVNAFIDGNVTADGAEVGSLSWQSVKLDDNCILQFTNMTVQRGISAGLLKVGENCSIRLSGTSTPLLEDHLSDAVDSWGGGQAALKLDNFEYARLANPSGIGRDDPASVAKWRNAWLDRQYYPRSLRPARHLAHVLRSQGLFEAARRALIEAFRAEGKARRNPFSRGMSWLFGLLFGYGLSGSRAFISLMILWALGIWGVIELQRRDFLVQSTANEPVTCSAEIDPAIYAADVMIPLIDLGQEKLCQPGRTAVTQAAPRAWENQTHSISGGWVLARFLHSVYAILGWIFVSLAIATWSGLFKRGGRE